MHSTVKRKHNGTVTARRGQPQSGFASPSPVDCMVRQKQGIEIEREPKVLSKEANQSHGMNM
jgi:hypothetical protein